MRTDGDLVPGARKPSGFTLIELMVVILIFGLMARMVWANFGGMVPESAMDSQVNQFRSWVDYLRSEAKIQGKPYTIELDLEKHRTRLLLPEEDKLVVTEDDTIAATIPLDWTDLGKWVKFHGHAVAGGAVMTRGTVRITFDENGFSADQAVFFIFDAENSELVWSLHIHGLSGTTKVHRNQDGDRVPMETKTEGHF